MADSPIKKIKYAAEFAPLALMLGVFSLMSPALASNVAGLIGRTIGPKLAASRKAMANLKMALPGKTDAEYKKIITGMWDNLARIMSEYQNLEFLAPDVELIGAEHLRNALQDFGQVVLFSGHVGNWEIAAPMLAYYDIRLNLVYRAPNNPWSDKVLDYFRTLKGRLATIPKSKSGTRLLVERMQRGESIMILIDQKYNEGIAAPFFGQPAMTSTAFVQLAQKYDCPLVPFRAERLDNKTSFRLSFYAPLETINSAGEKLPVEDVVAKAHGLLESWITEKPEQWIWLHRRWIDRKNPGKKAAAKMEKAKIAPRPKADQTPPAA